MENDLDRHYAAMLDSVAVVTALAASTDPDDIATVGRNVEHLTLMLTREEWEVRHDMEPIEDAIDLGA